MAINRCICIGKWLWQIQWQYLSGPEVLVKGMGAMPLPVRPAAMNAFPVILKRGSTRG